MTALGTFTARHQRRGCADPADGTPPHALPVARAASCEILNLVLGPLDLNLLGLEIILDTVHPQHHRRPRSGNLLGNLLCAVAGLLTAHRVSTLVAQISNLLNRILGLLD